jgi:hypothetical protein
MAKNNDTLRFEDYQAQAKQIASRLTWKAKRAGNPVLDKDTLYSDVCMTWVKCRDNFDESFGVPFKSYFMSAAYKNYGMFVRDHYDEVSAHSDSLHSEYDNDGEGVIKPIDKIEDEGVDIEALTSRRQMLRRMAGRFPLVVTLLDIIVNPPDELQSEIIAANEYYGVCERLGYGAHRPATMLTFSSLQKILGFNWRQKERLQEELKDAVEYIG